jgi:SAM-dependent methyltransferase
MTERARFIDRIYWRILRVIGFKKQAWDDQFRKNIWSRGRHSEYFVDRVVSLVHGGRLIEFGCAEGGLPYELPAGAYSEYSGYDISELAISTAIARAQESSLVNCVYQQCDMANWEGGSDISLILLEECLYYLNPLQMQLFLEKCKNSLLPDGVILVVVHSAEKHAKTLELCRLMCRVIAEVPVGGRVFLTLGK